MARPNLSAQRRVELAPVLAKTFAELGYRRTTTAELAARCGVGENVLYRLWADKRAMFVAALEYVYELSESTWAELLESSNGAATAAERILDYEAKHHGELGLYRIVFAGLSETEDPEIAAALRRLYGRFHAFVRRHVEGHRAECPAPPRDRPGARRVGHRRAGHGVQHRPRARPALRPRPRTALLGGRSGPDRGALTHTQGARRTPPPETRGKLPRGWHGPLRSPR